MSEELNGFEIEILEECAGIRAPHTWGAAVRAALEVLQGMGMIKSNGDLTEKGNAFLADHTKSGTAPTVHNG